MKKVLSIALALVLALSMFACGKTATPTEVTTDFLQAIKDKDSETLKAVYAGDAGDVQDGMLDDSDSDDADPDEYSSEIDKLYDKKVTGQLFSFDYKVGEEKIADNKATVDVEITTYNFKKAFEGFLEDYFTEGLEKSFSGATDEEMDKFADELLVRHFDKMKKDYKKTVKINLSKNEDGWVVDELPEDGDFYNAILGGLIDIKEDI